MRLVPIALVAVLLTGCATPSESDATIRIVASTNVYGDTKLLFEQAPIGLRVGLHHRQLRISGAGVGEPHADLKAKSCRAIGQSGDALRALDRRDDDKGFNPLGQAALDPVGREPAQPNRQVTPAGKHAHDDPTR